MRVLLLTAMPLRNDTNMGKTLLKLFSAFQSEELCCLYLGKGVPNSSACMSNFRLGEDDLFRGLLNTKPVGCIVSPILTDTDLMKSSRRSYIVRRKKNNIVIRLLREILWSSLTTKKDALESWLDEQKFDLVFFVLQDTNASLKLLDWILCRYEKKAFIYVTDDYLNDYSGGGLIRKHYFKKRKALLICLSAKVKMVVGVSDIATDWVVNLLKPVGGGANFSYSHRKRLLVDAIA